jgi:hypothetical protein
VVAAPFVVMLLVEKLPLLAVPPVLLLLVVLPMVLVVTTEVLLLVYALPTADSALCEASKTAQFLLSLEPNHAYRAIPLSLSNNGNTVEAIVTDS